MKVTTVPCTQCGTAIHYEHTHRMENTEGKQIEELCDTCCPNCFGGVGHGRPQPQ